MKHRTVIMIAASLFALIPMIVYTVTANMFVAKYGRQESDKLLVDMVKNQASNIEVYLDEVHTQLDMLASIDAVADAAKSSAIMSTDTPDVLERFAEDNESVFAAQLVDAGGNVIGGKDKGKVFENFASYSRYKDEVLYINDVDSAEKTGSMMNSTMFIKKQLSSCMLIVSYDINNGAFVTRVGNNSVFYTNGRIMLVDSSEGHQNWVSTGGYNNNLAKQLDENGVVRARMDSLQDNVPTEIIRYTKSESGFSSSSFSLCMMRVGGPDGIIVIATCPDSNAKALYTKAGSPMILATVFLGILAIAGAVAVAIFVTKPLKTIEETLIKIRRGDHEARITTVSNNEYGQISRAFNDLVDEIVVSEDRYRTIIEMSDNIIFEWNFKTNEVFFSNNFNKKFSYRPPSDHFGDSFLLKAKLHPDDSDKYREDLNQLEKGKDFERNEYRMKNIYGDFIWVLMRTATLHDKDGKPLKVVGVMVDIDRAKKSEQQLTARASFDALTELYNRETIESQIDNEIALSEARKSEMAVLFIDVDDFKHYNDNYSHATGDQVLKFVAKTIKETVAEFGFAGRYGGDEFIACIRNAELNGPDVVAKEIIQKLDSGFDTDTGKPEPEHMTVSVSIGIAVIKDDYNTRVEYLIGKADDAMYSVKKSGKSNFAFIS